jgi:hypothetical protein
MLYILKIIYIFVDIKINNMKKILTLLTLTTLFSCGQLDTTSQNTEQVRVNPTPTTENYSAKSIEYITGSLKTTGSAIGLYKITLQDGKEILLYNDSKGIAMIQLK